MDEVVDRFKLRAHALVDTLDDDAWWWDLVDRAMERIETERAVLDAECAEVIAALDRGEFDDG